MKLSETIQKLKDLKFDLTSINELDIANALNVDAEKAKSILDGIKLNNQSEAFDYYKNGLKKARNKNDIGALNDLNKAVQLDPENSLFISERGNVKYFLKDFNGACNDWKRAKEIGNLGEREKEVNGLIEKYCKNKVHSTQSKSSTKEGCYIATSIYGSYDAEEVIVLRKFRDNKLNTNFIGKLFVKIYYLTSPHFVKLTKNIAFINYFIKSILDLLVTKLKR
jgi:hypothetical protein